ncbi:MAG: hypothetical protein Q4C20_06045 [Erysipelotrichaceae bacterium]|jgi:hypothetical protein|nr:hypothetical protein [Erysipelotrichaceae bacterium]
MNKNIMRRAMIDYARNSYRREDNRYTAEQWINVMNGYVHHLDPAVCAERAEISPLEASLLYCRFSIVLSEEALKSFHSTRTS